MVIQETTVRGDGFVLLGFNTLQVYFPDNGGLEDALLAQSGDRMSIRCSVRYGQLVAEQVLWIKSSV